MATLTRIYLPCLDLWLHRHRYFYPFWYFSTPTRICMSVSMVSLHYHRHFQRRAAWFSACCYAFAAFAFCMDSRNAHRYRNPVDPGGHLLDLRTSLTRRIFSGRRTFSGFSLPSSIFLSATSESFHLGYHRRTFCILLCSGVWRLNSVEQPVDSTAKGGSRFRRNVGTCLPDFMVSRARRQQYS
jgi:hypothetical protein